MAERRTGRAALVRTVVGLAAAVAVGAVATLGGVQVAGATDGRTADARPAVPRAADASDTTTLRTLNKLPKAPASLRDSTLIMVDYQRTYTQGTMRLAGWRESLNAAADLLKRTRAAGGTVIHVQNDGGPGTPYDVRKKIGQIMPEVAPVRGEAVVTKKVPNAFVGTDLGKLVDRAGHRNVIIAGWMTHMCTLFTTEGAFLRGNRPTVVADASATRPLPSVNGDLTADQVHRSALATIGDLYGVVVRKGNTLK